MLKRKLKGNLIVLGLTALVLFLAGCVPQNQSAAKSQTIAATSVTVCEILDSLGVEANQVIQYLKNIKMLLKLVHLCHQI